MDNTEKLEDKKEEEKKLKKYKNIASLLRHDGGKELVSLLTKDIITSIDSLSHYRVLTHPEIVAQCARLTERLDLYRLLTSAKKNAEIVEGILKTEYTEDTD